MWKTSTDERLVNWQKFREDLGELPLSTALKNTAELWSRAPFKTYFLDPLHPETWPDPWKLVTERHYCDIARCLGMVYTIYFTKHRTNVLPEIRIYQDINACKLYVLLSINDGQYILNWVPEEIVNINIVEENQLQLLYQYSGADLKLEKY